MTIGLVLNTQKERGLKVVNQVLDLLNKKNIPFLIEAETAKMMGRRDKRATYSVLKEKVDLIIIFGGDGTFLHTAHHFIGTDIPLLGINLGSLGFLTEIEVDELEEALKYLFQGNYLIEKRMLLNAQVLRQGKEVYNSQALNDVVINRGVKLRMIDIELSINEEIVNSYQADGLIIATPTGSTAYSLSAGGPIVNPQIRAILITPICPHTMYIRPMVISNQEKIKIVIFGEDLMKFTADGRHDYTLLSGDEIFISAAKEEISIIKLPKKTFYTLLHKKMKIGFL